MENKDIILQELMETAPTLAHISREMPFAVPEGYFELLPVSILGEIAPKSGSFSVPEGYFDSLPEILLQKAKAASSPEPALEQEEVTYPVLEAISKQMPYSVPNGYFEQLEISIPADEAPVIPIRRSFRRVAGWAVAASVLAVMSLFGYRHFSGSDSVVPGELVSNETGTEDSIAAMELASALSEVEDTNLHAELDSYGYTADRAAIYYLKTVNFEQALQTLSDEEIKKNLEAQGYFIKDKKS